jgi:hypothetical protein
MPNKRDMIRRDVDNDGAATYTPREVIDNARAVKRAKRAEAKERARLKRARITRGYTAPEPITVQARAEVIPSARFLGPVDPADMRDDIGRLKTATLLGPILNRTRRRKQRERMRDLRRARAKGTMHVAVKPLDIEERASLGIADVRRARAEDARRAKDIEAMRAMERAHTKARAFLRRFDR